MITQPTNETPLPDDVQKQLTSAYNSITLANAEVTRLRDLRISEEANIVELNKQKVYAQEQLDIVSAKLTSSEEELKKNTDLIAFQTSEIVLQREEKVNLANSLTERENACGAKENDLKNKEVSFALRGASLNERTVLVEDREINVKEKENKIKELCLTLA